MPAELRAFNAKLPVLSREVVREPHLGDEQSGTFRTLDCDKECMSNDRDQLAVSTALPDEWDHEGHMRQALELAREAGDRGDDPFGAVLVRNDTVIMRERNAVDSASDIRRHPELRLAERAHRELDAGIRSETVMYTSTEPCAMCTGGIHIADLAAVVYGIDGTTAGSLAPGERAVPTAETDAVPFVGPILESMARAVHEDCWPASRR